MTELERKDKPLTGLHYIAELLARAIEINSEIDRLTAKRRMISEQIYELQKGDK